MEELLENLSKIRSDVNFKTEQALIDGGILGSLDIVQIIAMVNDVFDVRVPVSKTRPANFNSAEKMWDLIQELQDED